MILESLILDSADIEDAQSLKDGMQERVMGYESSSDLYGASSRL